MDFLQFLSDKFSGILKGLFDMLPKSPIVYLQLNPQISRILSYVNWFCPVYLWISILENWLVCIFVYYAVQVVLRWIKVIE